MYINTHLVSFPHTDALFIREGFFFKSGILFISIFNNSPSWTWWHHSLAFAFKPYTDHNSNLGHSTYHLNLWFLPFRDMAALTYLPFEFRVAIWLALANKLGIEVTEECRGWFLKSMVNQQTYSSIYRMSETLPKSHLYHPYKEVSLSTSWDWT